MESTATQFDPIRQICVLARRLWSINHRVTPAQVAFGAFMDNPRPGDLVIEVSNLAWRERKGDLGSGLGRMVLKRSEFVPFTESEGGYHDEFTYIETLDGRLERWSNCEFLRLPEAMFGGDEPNNSAWLADALERHKDDFYAKT